MSKELLLTSEKTGQQHNIIMTDLHTGTTIKTFKDDSSVAHSLCIARGEYVISAINNKPLAYSWAIESKEKAKAKLVLPGLSSALAITPDGNFLVAAVSEKLYVWQTTSGDLLAVLSQHHQAVRTIKFTDDAEYVITAADDNLIIVWEFWKIVQRNQSVNSVTEPLHIWTGHSLPITDFHLGSGGASARCISVSLDHTCKIWDLLSGKCLTTFVFKHPLTAIAMDTSEMHLFIGDQKGKIHKINIHQKPLHEVNPTLDAMILQGHDQAVRSLAVSLDGSLLVSGSDDGNVMIWDITSGQCIRTISHKGAITNLVITMTPEAMLQPGKYHAPIMQLKLKKTLTSDQDNESVVQIAGSNQDSVEFMDIELTEEELKKYFENEQKTDTGQLEAMQNLKDEMGKWKDLCQLMYQKTVTDIIADK